MKPKSRLVEVVAWFVVAMVVAPLLLLWFRAMRVLWAWAVGG